MSEEMLELIELYASTEVAAQAWVGARVGRFAAELAEIRALPETEERDG